MAAPGAQAGRRRLISVISPTQSGSYQGHRDGTGATTSFDRRPNAEDLNAMRFVMAEMTEMLDEVTALIGRLKNKYPTEINSFLSFMESAEGGPALTAREKELINIGIAVATQCQWCIAVHVKHAVATGATRDQIAEAGFMAVLMHGGPALMHLVPLFKALDEFLPETQH
jgi:AhpD family alkylhydroperoxidase